MIAEQEQATSYEFSAKLDDAASQVGKDIAWITEQSGVKKVIDHDSDMEFQRRGIDFTVVAENGVQTTIEHKTENYDYGRVFLETVSVEHKNKPGCMLTTQSDEVVFRYPPSGIALVIPTKELQAFMGKKEHFEKHTYEHPTSTPDSHSPGGKYYTIGRIVSWPRLFHEVPGIRSRVIDHRVLVKKHIHGNCLATITGAPKAGIHATNGRGASFYISANLPEPKISPKSPASAQKEAGVASRVFFREQGLFERCEEKGKFPLTTLRDSKADFYMHIFPDGAAYICNREELLASIDKNKLDGSESKSPRSSHIDRFIDGSAGGGKHPGTVVPNKLLPNYIRQLDSGIPALSKPIEQAPVSQAVGLAGKSA